MMQWISDRDATVLRASRNFYGTLKVFDYLPDSPDEHYYLLMHGATTHGLQFVSPEKALLPTSYYGEHSGIGLALRHLPRESGRQLGLVGLGTGTLAVYGQAGDTLRIYEINPAVEKLARDPFTHLARSPAKIDVVMGDARLSLEQELTAGQPQQFDLLALDAFSSDAIPAHLLTKEAFELYLKHMRPDGVIAVHISNRYLDLEPIMAQAAQEMGWTGVVVYDEGNSEPYYVSNTWVLLSKSPAVFAHPNFQDGSTSALQARKGFRTWTDDYSNIIQILR
jgi:hypothetical protein